jgi:transcriptional regulator with GAF, ATPase, and Fis domain
MNVDCACPDSSSRGQDSIVGTSKAIAEVRATIRQIAPTSATILILGETGTGKELVARAIHRHSPRHRRQLVKVNCASLSSSLIESELFGHERGSFTGADRKRRGRFELADQGTLFLDEIGELPLRLQAKLLRVLEDMEFERIGGNRTIRADVRIIAATNRDLEQAVARGTFRQDLFYRLNIFPLTVPPLRERVDDIALIADHYRCHFAATMNKKIHGISSDTLRRLSGYQWPGNVRELKNVIQRAVISANGPYLHLVDALGPARLEQHKESWMKPLHDVEREHILQALTKTNWKVSGKNSAAELLALDRGTLRRKMAKLGLRRPTPGRMCDDQVFVSLRN